MTGGSTGVKSGFDYATIGYNAATGRQLWVRRYNGPDNSTDNAAAVALSPSGRQIFVTGYSHTATTNQDYATIAYNAATGRRLWVERYGGPGDNAPLSAVAVSPNGHAVFITGASYDPRVGSGYAYATIGYRD